MWEDSSCPHQQRAFSLRYLLPPTHPTPNAHTHMDAFATLASIASYYSAAQASEPDSELDLELPSIPVEEDKATGSSGSCVIA